MYLRFYIDWAAEVGIYVVYFTVHLISLSFYIGLCFYVSAMLADLGIRLEEIDMDIKDVRSFKITEIECKLSADIEFHTHIFE